MTRHLGVSVFYSVLIVVFFAVVLYQPETIPGTATGPDQAPLAPEPPPSAEASAAKLPPAPTPGTPLTEATPVPADPRTMVSPNAEPVADALSPPIRQAPLRQPEASPLPGSDASRPLARVTVVKTGSSARTADRAKTRGPGEPPAARAGFIRVWSGETLADVALRVYGSSDAVPRLWTANRDILPKRDAPLSAGTVLRAP